MSDKLFRTRLALEDGLVELRRNGTGQWIWAQTCPAPDCGCRSAVTVASRSGSRDALLKAAAVVRARSEVGLSMQEAEEEIGEDCAVFDLDIDTAEARGVKGNRCIPPLERYPWLDEVLGEIDGEALEQLGRLWYRGKGRDAPDTTPQPPDLVDEWEPWQDVSWIEAYFGVRMDCFVVDGRRHEAVDLYCVDPECDCGRVRVRFDVLDSDYPEFVGVVTVEGSAIELMPMDGPKELLEQLWAAYQKRHPAWRDRHAKRYPRMKEFGRILHAQHAPKAASKVGPNDRCPCGSGKKYKKCCWQKTLAGRA